MGTTVLTDRPDGVVGVRAAGEVSDHGDEAVPAPAATGAVPRRDRLADARTRVAS